MTTVTFKNSKPFGFLAPVLNKLRENESLIVKNGKETVFRAFAKYDPDRKRLVVTVEGVEYVLRFVNEEQLEVLADSVESDSDKQ